MKKNLAIVLALVLVLCATVALAAEGTLVNGNYVVNPEMKGHSHYWFASAKDLKNAGTLASGTNLPCEFVTKKSTPADPIYTKVDELTHLKEQKTVTTGYCKFCLAEMDPQNDWTTSVEAHTLVRGAYKGRNYDIVPLAHSDSAHLIAYDQYVSVCSVCKESVIENVPVYEAHTFRTAKPIGYYADGSEKYGKGSTCSVCGYARAYKMLTTAAGKKVDEIIAAYEAAGLTVEFDANQMIAVGIEEGEAVEVEEGICGVNTIMFTNFSPIKKGNTNKVETDLDVTYKSSITFNKEWSEDPKAPNKVITSSMKDYDEHSHVDAGSKDAYTDAYHYYSFDWDKIKSVDNILVDEFGNTLKDKDGNPLQYVTDKNLVQDTKSYSAAFVTMYVEGIAHRVYFYERHDGNGWVYAFEADMYADVKEVVLPEYEVDDQGFKYKAYEAFVTRTGAGQEYATNGVIAAGKTIKSIGLAYEGSDKNQYGKEVGSETLYKGKTWGWDMIDDWTFVATSRIAAK